MAAKKATAHWIILAACALVGALLLFGIAMQQSEVRAVALAPPLEISLEKLRTNPPGPNKHILLTQFALSRHYAVESQRGTWQKVWIPAFGPNDADAAAPVAVVVNSPYPRNDDDLFALAEQPTIKGILKRKSALIPGARAKLQENHPGLDFSDAWVLEELRHVPSEDAIRWCNIAGAVLGVLGIALLGIWLTQRRRPPLSPAEDFLPEAKEDDPALRGRVVAEFPTGSKLHYFVLIACPILAALFLGIWIFALVGAARAEDANASMIVAIVLATLFLAGLGIFFLIGFFYAIFALAWKLVIYENGVLVQKRRSARWIPWTLVRAYCEQNVILNGVSTGHQITLDLRSGKSFKIESVFKDVSAAIAAIRELLIPVLTREAQARLKDGRSVDFEHVVMHADGLEKAETRVPWRDVESIAIEPRPTTHNVAVRIVGRKKPLVDVPVGAFPNVDVFMALAPPCAGGDGLT